MKASIFYFRPFVYAKYGEKSLMVFSPYLCVACLYTQTFTVQWKNHGEFLPMVFLPQCTASSVSVHCILGFSALSSRLQCTASVDANVCGKGCKRLWEGL